VTDCPYSQRCKTLEVENQDLKEAIVRLNDSAERAIGDLNLECDDLRAQVEAADRLAEAIADALYRQEWPGASPTCVFCGRTEEKPRIVAVRPWEPHEADCPASLLTAYRATKRVTADGE
jgi:hypothetical protein